MSYSFNLYPKVYDVSLTAISTVVTPSTVTFADPVHYILLNNVSNNTASITLNNDAAAVFTIPSHSSIEFPPNAFRLTSVKVNGADATEVIVYAGASK